MGAEEPPVVTVRGGEAVEQIGEQLVPVLPAAEPDQPVDAGGGGKHHGVAREIREVSADRGERPSRIAIDGDAERLDVGALARVRPSASARERAAAARASATRAWSCRLRARPM